MAKNKKFQAPADEKIPDAAGLQVTQPVSEPYVSDETDPVDQVESFEPDADVVSDVSEEYAAPVVSTTAPTDPEATIAACLLSVGTVYNQMGILSGAIVKHLPKIAGEPELHAFLMRVQGVCGDFRHAIDQLEHGMSDRLREAIAQAVAA